MREYEVGSAGEWVEWVRETEAPFGGDGGAGGDDGDGDGSGDGGDRGDGGGSTAGGDESDRQGDTAPGGRELDGDDPVDFETDWWEVLRAQRQRAAERLWNDRLAGKSCHSYQTRRASRLVTRFFDRALRAQGVPIRITQIAVLLAIRNARERERMADIAKKLWMHPSTLSRAIERLEARGYVETMPAHWDRRVRTARLTPLGTAELRAAHEAWMLARTVIRIPLTDEKTARAGVRLIAEAARLRLHAQGLRWEMWAPPNVDPSMM